MPNLFNDIRENFLSYYDSFVALLPKLTFALIVFALFLLTANAAQRFSQRRLTDKMDDPLLARFISRLIGVLIVAFATLLTLQIIGLGAMALGLLSTAGLSAFIIGYAFKDIGENFLAGVVLAFNRPFRIGDTVQLNNNEGVVVMLNLRDTQIKTFDGKDVFIPNAMVVKNPVVNYTLDGLLRLDFTLRLDYSTPLSAAMPVIQEALGAVPGILQGEKAPYFALGGLDPSVQCLTVFFWIDTTDQKVSGLKLKIEAVEKVLKALKEKGFYLPAEILELRNYRNEASPVLQPLAN